MAFISFMRFEEDISRLWDVSDCEKAEEEEEDLQDAVASTVLPWHDVLKRPSCELTVSGKIQMASLWRFMEINPDLFQWRIVEHRASDRACSLRSFVSLPPSMPPRIGDLRFATSLPLLRDQRAHLWTQRVHDNERHRKQPLRGGCLDPTEEKEVSAEWSEKERSGRRRSVGVTQAINKQIKVWIMTIASTASPILVTRPPPLWGVDRGPQLLLFFFTFSIVEYLTSWLTSLSDPHRWKEEEASPDWWQVLEALRESRLQFTAIK